MNQLLDSLHSKILKSKFAEEVTEAEIDALVKAKQGLNENNQGWIPCSVDMPKELGKCIVKLKDGRSSEVIYDNIYKRFVLYGHEVIAWQPFPASYKPKGE